MPVTELKLKTQVRHACAASQEGMMYVVRQTHLFTGHRFPATTHFSALWATLSWQPQGQTLCLPRPRPLSGVCTTHVPRELARYRSVSVRPANKTPGSNHFLAPLKMWSKPRYGLPSLGQAPRHVLAAIIKKRLKLEASLYTILQILSVTLFERMPL